MRLAIRACIVGVVGLSLATSAHAQLVVSDPANLAKAALIAATTLQEYQTAVAQYTQLVQMSKPLAGMDRYTLPPVSAVFHDPSRYPYGAAMLNGLNNGDPNGVQLAANSHPLLPADAALAQLDPRSRRMLTDALATIQIADSIDNRAMDSVASSRGYTGTVAGAIAALQSDIFGGGTALHSLTAVLDKLTGASLVARKQDAVTNQVTSHALEELLVQAKRKRDTEAASVNMQINQILYAPDFSRALLAGSAEALTSWRQP